MPRKSKLEQMVEPEVSEVLDDALGVALSVPEAEEPKSDVPSRFSPHWHEYVMSQFVDEELSDGNPTVDGLRRVVQQVIGPIVGTYTTVVQSPARDNDGRATVMVEVLVQQSLVEGDRISFCGAADCSKFNTPDTYAKHAVATAESKAEGRALRKMLGLRKVLTAEEATTGDYDENLDTWNPDSPITSELITAFDYICRTNNISVMRFINIGKAGYETIKEVPFGVARRMLEVLNEYKTGTRKIPDVIVGYEENWMEKK